MRGGEEGRDENAREATGLSHLYGRIFGGGGKVVPAGMESDARHVLVMCGIVLCGGQGECWGGREKRENNGEAPAGAAWSGCPTI